jgi:hypothetical protein
MQTMLYLPIYVTLFMISVLCPEAWSKGVIVPIYIYIKKGDKNIPANYRGITCINVIGRICFFGIKNSY